MSVHSYNKEGKTFYRIIFRVNGKQKQRRGFNTKIEARKAERDLLAKVDDGKQITSPRLTLRDYLNTWHSGLEGTRKVGQSQRKRIRQHLNNIISELGNIKVTSLTYADIIDLRRKLETNLAARTIKHMEGTLKGALNDGVKQNIISSNPIQFLETNSVPLDGEKEIEVFEPEEQRQLINSARAYAKEHDLRWFILVHLGLHTGARKGELFGLKWKHINFKEQEIRVEQSLEFSEGDTKGRLKVPKTKSGKRNIAMSKNLAEEIRKYKLWAKEYYLKFKKRVSEDDFVIFHDDFGPLHKSAPITRWETIVRRAGLRPRGFHTLRHTHASNMIDAELNIKIIQKRLGHASINITLDIYGHIFKHGKDKEISALEYWEAKTLRG